MRGKNITLPFSPYVCLYLCSMKISDPRYVFSLLQKKGPFYVAKQSLTLGEKYVRQLAQSLLYLPTLQKLPQNMSIPDVLNFVENECQGYFKPIQIRNEITSLLKHIQKIKPKIVVEIGTASGGTLLCLTKVSPSNATFISIDLPAGPFGGGSPWYKKPLFHAFVSGEQHMHLLRLDSHAPSTQKKLENILHSKKVDFMLIDGDHTYEGVKKDFEMYSPYVKKGGTIAFHDIVTHNTEANCRVDKFWQEIKKKYSSETFVESWKQGVCGIGIIEYK